MTHMRTTIVTTLLGSLLAACGAGLSSGRPGYTMSDTVSSEKMPDLLERPDIDTMLDQYERIRTEMRVRLSAELDLAGKWRKPREPAEGLCGSPHSDVPNAVNVYMANWVNNAEIPEDQWDHAQSLFKRITGRHGFGDLQVVTDAPNDHLIRASDAYGGAISLGTKKATMLSLDTGCHPTADAHPGDTSDAPS
ncbi:LppA family lipoprotein [Saccharomonospora iraqiensis]|uniref:LppA family lipoprotein n=1 Tax=Saccharomonospora iraqiensis TaxID=52698 RepID=UPI001377C7D7|nr:LppA family lipoprotein [Saccharomonospora iraqiensis]